MREVITALGAIALIVLLIAIAGGVWLYLVNRQLDEWDRLDSE